jgi:hypothetical protein
MRWLGFTAWKVSVGIFSARFKISDKPGQRRCVKWLETENFKTRLVQVPVQDFQVVLPGLIFPAFQAASKLEKQKRLYQRKKLSNGRSCIAMNPPCSSGKLVQDHQGSIEALSWVMDRGGEAHVDISGHEGGKKACHPQEMPMSIQISALER